MTMKNRITVAAEELRRHGGHPHQVCLTPDDAIQLQYELIGQGGELSRQFDRAILVVAGSDSRGRQRRKPLSGVNKTDHAHPVNLATNQAKGSGFTTADVRDP